MVENANSSLVPWCVAHASYCAFRTCMFIRITSVAGAIANTNSLVLVGR